MSILVEDLKHRRIVRVAIAYVLTSVGLICSLGVLNAWLPLPEWTMRLVAGTAWVILPFVLVMTWALEDHGPDNLRVSARRR